MGTTLVSITLFLGSLLVLLAGWSLLLYPLALTSVLWVSFWVINNEWRFKEIDLNSTPHAMVKEAAFSKSNFIEGVTAFPRHVYLYIKKHDQLASFLLYSMAIGVILGNILFVFAVTNNWHQASVIITLILMAIFLSFFMLNKLEAYVVFILKALLLLRRISEKEGKERTDLDATINWVDVILITLILGLLLYAFILPSHFLSLLQALINLI